ncbi:uricase [Fistulina hepatica ATCC 64428]|uniref:Uricase n=1 Tax=Fistulina hepatica ATCC 64428 TaxID=1128425 RepID=A0A0D7AKS0_9AGAR|nr:uricase [Fistulina hepatica ATCC 64428]
MSCALSHALYGKDKVRVFRVVREGGFHNVVEYNVRALMEGDIETSYTQADNSVVMFTRLTTTYTVKNITYFLAKVSPHVLNPERFALHLGTFLVSKYKHIHKAFVDIEMLKWSRIPVSEGSDVKPHPFSFVRDGEEKRIVSVEVDASNGKDKITGLVKAGIKDLLVLKSSGSAFTNFWRDEYTTLVEVDDRIFSTSVDLEYTYAPFSIASPTDEKKLEFVVPGVVKGGVWDSDGVFERARNVTLQVFATDDSASVQATLYKMEQQIIAENDGVDHVKYTLPNKHYVPVDMSYIGIGNTKPTEAEVFIPLAAPSGLISATASRTK